MNYYVRKGEKVQDSYGNENTVDSLYHTWYCVIN